MAFLRAIAAFLCVLPVAGCGWIEQAKEKIDEALDAEHGVLFYAYDTLARPGEPVDLVARVQKSKNTLGLGGVTVAFYNGKELLGQAVTAEDGRARISWTPQEAGDYHFTARPVALPGDIDGDYKDLLKVTPAPLLVTARTGDARFVVIDLDGTVVGGSFKKVLSGDPKPIADSVKVTRKIAQQYSIVYLTHRPDLLMRTSKLWLGEHGFPPGPLLVSNLKEAFGDSGRFKTAKLAEMRKEFPNVEIGIGDKLSDAQAYADNGLTAYLMPNYKPNPWEMRKLAKEIRGLRWQERLQVVSGWSEVEAGILAGAKYPPEEFARRLEARAN